MGKVLCFSGENVIVEKYDKKSSHLNKNLSLVFTYLNLLNDSGNCWLNFFLLLKNDR